jgi:hypothetical protein
MAPEPRNAGAWVPAEGLSVAAVVGIGVLEGGCGGRLPSDRKVKTKSPVVPEVPSASARGRKSDREHKGTKVTQNNRSTYR